MEDVILMCLSGDPVFHLLTEELICYSLKGKADIWFTMGIYQRIFPWDFRGIYLPW